MNRLIAALAVGVPALALVFGLSSCGVLGGPPGSVQLQADTTGAEVVVLWTEPVAGPADRYAVYFTPLEGAEELVAETTATISYHDPEGRTGSYRVEALFGADRYSAANEPSTVPVFTDTVQLDELNVAGGLAGFGWSRTTGEGATYDMRDAGNAPRVDFYLTDFLPGWESAPYALLGPASCSLDLGAVGVIPDAEWKVCGLSNHLPDEQAVLPSAALRPPRYFTYTNIDFTPFNAGCWLPDGYYALVKIAEVDTVSGHAKLVAWFQLVPGLRLIRH